MIRRIINSGVIDRWCRGLLIDRTTPSRISFSPDCAPCSLFDRSSCSAAWRDALRVRRADAPPVLLLPHSSFSIEPSGPPLRLTKQMRSELPDQTAEGLMQSLLVVLMSIGLAVGSSVAYAAEQPVGASDVSSQNLSSATVPASPHTEDALSGTTQPRQPTENPDCDDARPSTANSRTILSRFTRLSPTTSDVQCPIPAVAGPSTEQELHP